MMDSSFMEQYDQYQGGLGIFESYDHQDLMGVGMGVGVHAHGGSRSSKSSKKKEDEDDPGYTTVMLRNIPNKYTRQMLIDQLHRTGFRGNIDYMYLPTDFANRCNVGYCFVNFREASARKRFVQQFDGVAAQSCLPGFNSYKVCQVTRAKWQGREENVRRLKSGPELMAQLAAHPEWLPLLLDSEGNQEVFLCDNEGVSAARSPAAPRRQMRKKQGGFSYPDDMALAFPFGFPPEYMGGDAMGRGKGGGRGGKKGRGGGMGSYADGMMSGMMAMGMMTGDGVQYVPYDASYDGGYFMPYQPSDAFGMSGYAGSSYPQGWWGGEGEFADGFATAAGMWSRGTGKQQRGRRRGSGGSGDEVIPTVVENDSLEVVEDEDS